jgi:hypothetical protein
MPLKLNVGVSRKVGLPDYSSVGASCNLELELDTALLEKDLDGLHARIREAYVAAHKAVHDELARLDALRTDAPERGRELVHSAVSPRNGYGTSNGSNERPRFQGDRFRNLKPATPNQVKAILAICRKQGTDLVGLLRCEYEVEQPEDLTIRQASELIDRLKSNSVA